MARSGRRVSGSKSIRNMANRKPGVTRLTNIKINSAMRPRPVVTGDTDPEDPEDPDPERVAKAGALVPCVVKS